MSDNVFILLFRGINVGGNKIVKMETLRKALTGAGLGQVKTYIQSGNVVLTARGDEASVTATVEAVFEPAFGFASRPTVRSLQDWRRLIDENPFPEAAADGRREHAVILDAMPTPEALDALRQFVTTEQMHLRDGVLYLYTPDGFGTSKVAAMLDRTLRVPWTARNWNTVLKLQELAEAIGT